MQQSGLSQRTKNIAIVAGAIVLVSVILWIDVATGVWSELVILGGLAAGLVTFILTALVLDKILAKSTAKRWAPVTRLAVSEFLHAIADDEKSEISRGRIVPRAFAEVSADQAADAEALHALREQVVHERAQLADVLSRWADFLASSSNSEDVLLHIANIAMQLDELRDLTLEVEHAATPENIAALNEGTRVCNAGVAALMIELQSLLEADKRARSRSRSK